MNDDEVVTLWRPTGPEEMELLAISGYRRWPPRLPGQTIFYPVLNVEYASQIARDWNVPKSGVGYVTKFRVRRSFLDRYQVHQVGGRTILEYWIPAGDLEAELVHVQGTANVVRAAERAGVARLAHLSFLRARPNCGSAYHESKWAAEELVRSSSFAWTVLKPGMMFGRGDHMLDHLSHALYTFPFFLGIGPRRVRPLAVEDAVDVLMAALVDGRLPRKTVGLVGPTEIGFDDAARLVATVLGKRRPFVRLPLAFHFLMARAAERLMTVPLISLAQVRILREEVIEATNAPDSLPADLVPTTAFNEEAIRARLPESGPFRLDDLRCFASAVSRGMSRCP
jgi:uncharacterized protein YbjT (DUF2867 family)